MGKRRLNWLSKALIIGNILLLGAFWCFIWWKDFLIWKNLVLLGGGFLLSIGVMILGFRRLKTRNLRLFYLVVIILDLLVVAIFGYTVQSLSHLSSILSSDNRFPSHQYLIVPANSKITSLRDFSRIKIGFLGGEPYTSFFQLLNSESQEYQTQKFTNPQVALQSLDGRKIRGLLLGDWHLSQLGITPEQLQKRYRIIHQMKKPSLLLESQPFVLYLIGYDGYGKVEQQGQRNDVNILVIFHPETKQILTISTPRDSYVAMPCLNRVPDKLSHSGNKGIPCAVATLGELYGIQIDYFVSLNFTSVREIVNILGGVEIENERYFHTFHSMTEPENQFEFPQGKLRLNGFQTLSYVRERKFFGDERERGKNQQKVIRAIFRKLITPEMLLRLPDLFAKISPYLETNFGWKDLSQLIKLQQSDNRPWSFREYSLKGEFGSAPSPLVTELPAVSVFFHYEASIEQAQTIIQKFLKGEDITRDLTQQPQGGKLLHYQFVVQEPPKKELEETEAPEADDSSEVDQP